ncbi:MAG TPA: CAP domain-containing protein [Candidatus Obscuribacterales bacterium]
MRAARKAAKRPATGAARKVAKRPATGAGVLVFIGVLACSLSGLIGLAAATAQEDSASGSSLRIDRAKGEAKYEAPNSGSGKTVQESPNTENTGGMSSLAGEDMLGLEEARQYMISIINRDRASLGLKAVARDEVATRAGQDHSDEMARLGYLSHWDTGGRKPDQRYTECGGKGFVMENCHIEESGYPDSQNENGRKMAKLEDVPRFDRKTLDDIEDSFFGEKPPHDGHRKNIIDPFHTHVGIGLSIADDGNTRRLTCTQEFVNNYAELADIPSAIKVGESFRVAGKLPDGLRVHGIDIYWDELPKKMSIRELARTASYGPPTLRLKSYFPVGAYQPLIKTAFSGARQEFSLEIATDSSWKPGLYYVYIWAKNGGGTGKESFLISSRTITIN